MVWNYAAPVHVAKSLFALRSEFDKLFPNRTTLSDGAKGNATHAAGASDHNPDYTAKGSRYGIIRAIDLTTTSWGVAMADRSFKAAQRAWHQALIADLIATEHANPIDRIFYLIHWIPGDAHPTIWSRTYGWRPQRYNGASPHDHHFHTSIMRTAAAENDTKPWFTKLHAKPAPDPVPTPVPPVVPPTPPTPSNPVPIPTPEPSPAPVPVIELDAPGAGNWQGAVMNSATRHWYIAEARKRADGGEDTLFHHFDAEGKYLDSMTCTPAAGYGIHCTAFGVSDGDVLWFTWNEDTNDVVTLTYRPGVTATKADATPMHVFSDGNVQISFSPTRDWAALRRIKTDTEEYRRYRKADILDGKDEQWGQTVVVDRTPDRTVQGFSLVNATLYVLTGLPSHNQPSRIEAYSFETGKPLGVTRIGLEGEPEGMDGRYYALKVGRGDARRLHVIKGIL